jgi:hypothetical protein
MPKQIMPGVKVFHEKFFLNFVKPQVKTGEKATLIIEVTSRFLSNLPQTPPWRVNLTHGRMTHLSGYNCTYPG